MRWAKHHKMADFMEEEKKVQYFPEGSLLNTMIISIIDSEKRFTDILKEPYTVYLIETKWVQRFFSVFTQMGILLLRVIRFWSLTSSRHLCKMRH